MSACSPSSARNVATDSRARCLDSWAVIAWFEDHPRAAARVDELLEHRPIMSWINLGEVAYIIERREGRTFARQLVAELRARLRLEVPTPQRVLEAAALKATRRMSYADAFGIATSVAHKAVFVTGDPELIDGDPDWAVEDLR